MATKDEIQREMESIRSMRRISSQSGPGSIPLDPDLPSHSVGTTEGGGFSIPGIAGLNLSGAFFVPYRLSWALVCRRLMLLCLVRHATLRGSSYNRRR